MLVFWLFILLALLHFLPAVAAAMPRQLQRLYGVSPDDGLTLTLLQHRALLLGLVGEAFLIAAFLEGLRWPALIGGVTSMAGFLIIAAMRGELFGRLRLITVFDVIGMAVAILLFFLMRGS